MANIHLNGSGNSHISLGNSNNNNGNVSIADPTMPKYVGARAEVKRVDTGILIWMKDYKGETAETIAEAIDSITTNADGSLTFTLPDGRTITTSSLKGDTVNFTFTDPDSDGNVVISNENCTISQIGFHISTEDPTSEDGKDGDVWIKYTESA